MRSRRAHPVAVLRRARARGWFEGIVARRADEFTYGNPYGNPYAGTSIAEMIGLYVGWHRGYTAEKFRAELTQGREKAKQ